MSSADNANYLIRVALDSGITDRAELAHFMGQMEVESGGFVSMNERLGYSAERLLQVFPGRNGVNTRAEAEAVVAGGPEAIANSIYGGAWGANNLGNTEAGDGWKFHGRGYVQLTGRANYAARGEDLGLDLLNHPELAADRENAANIAVHYWQNRVVPNGHQLDVRAATRDINGGYNHLSERSLATQRWANRFQREYLEENGLVAPLPVTEDPPAREPLQGTEGGANDRRRMIEEDGPRDTSIPLGVLSTPEGAGMSPEGPRSGSTARIMDEPLYRNVRSAVERMETSIGKQWDENSERLSASLYGLAREKGFAPDDSLRVAFNEPTATRHGGEIVFLQRDGTGASPDPFANRTHMATQDALANSPDATLRMVAAQDAERVLAQQATQQIEQSEQQRQGEHLRLRS